MREFKQKLEDLIKAFSLEDYSKIAQDDNFFRQSGISFQRSGSPGTEDIHTDLKERAVKQITSDIKLKNEFYDVCKNYTTPITSNHQYFFTSTYS